jgi:hypothetical protein
VPERIQKLYELHPFAIVETHFRNRETYKDDGFIFVSALIYRDETSSRGTTGNGWCKYPGLTKFTQGSELMKAETTAVGRALAMMGFLVNRGMASREEIDVANDGQSDQAIDDATVPVPVSSVNADREPGPVALANDVHDDNHCPEHNLTWFMRGAMKGFAHPIEDSFGTTIGWCNKDKWQFNNLAHDVVES